VDAFTRRQEALPGGGTARARRKRDDEGAVFGGARAAVPPPTVERAAPAPTCLYPAAGKSSVGRKQLELVDGSKGKGKEGKGKAAAPPARDADLQALAVKVINCLACGKVREEGF